MARHPMNDSRLLAFVAVTLVLTGCAERQAPEPDESISAVEEADFVGSVACVECHLPQYEKWQNSHHDLAMQEANAKTVLGNFDDQKVSIFGIQSHFFRRDDEYWVETENGSGETEAFKVAYTFGVQPLQQYLLEFSRGRLQALSIAWDTRTEEEGGQRWFHLYPDEHIRYDDPLHWTGLAQNWNYMCAECHSTNLQKNYSANDDSYATTWSEIDVACESCHGPGSAHIARAKDGDDDSGSGLVLSLDDHGSAVWQMSDETGIAALSEPALRAPIQPESCGRCHSRRGAISLDYEYGKPLLDTHMPALLEPGLYHADGQILDEVYVYGSFLQSKMYQAGVTCSDCHDPHSLELKVGGEVSNVCSQCHAPARFANSEHHFHSSDDVQCVDCHMPATNYMVVDPRRDHSFRVPRPDLSDEIGGPNACIGCHSEENNAWASSATSKWYGTTRADTPHYGQALHAGQENTASHRNLIRALIDERSEPGIVRATAFELMTWPLDASDVDRLRKGLASADPLLRVGALRQLESMPPDARVPLAVPLLSDLVRAVRIAAVNTLASSRDTLRQARRAEFDAAAIEYVEAQQATAEQPGSQTNLGNYYRDTGNLDVAEEAYARALAIQPRWVAARINRADLYRLRGQDDKSIDELSAGLRLDANDAALTHAMGLALVRGGEAGKALEYLSKAAELAPDNIRYSYVHAIAMHSLSKTDEALEVLRSIYDRHPADFDTAWALATISRDAGNIEQARQYAQALAEIYPDAENVRQLLQAL
jgi:tetratricopeptide (TPR) repeat protein